MTSVTYQTKVPAELHTYCEAMGFLFGEVERHLYKALSRGEKLNTQKKDYQLHFGINARQFNSVHFSIKGKIESLKECHKRHIKELTERIKELEKNIKKLIKRLKSTQPACGLKGKSERKLIKWKLHHKKRKLASLLHNLETIKTQKPSLIFGGKKLWKAQFNLEANGYESHEQWNRDWEDARQGQFMLVGSKDETSGCQFLELLSSRTSRFGIELIPLNPAYSSFIGMTKFMPMYGLSSDTAAALVLARRALRKSERVKAFLARFLPVDRMRHSWSYWNSLLKKFGGVRRHDFFNSDAANSGMVVTPADESIPHGIGRSSGKRRRASIDG